MHRPDAIAVMDELREVFSLDDPAVIVERVRFINETIEGGDWGDVESEEFLAANDRNMARRWAILNKWYELAHRVEAGEPAIAEAVAPESSVAAEELLGVLGVDSLAFVLPRVRALRDQYTQITGGDDIVHYYDDKHWRSVQFWKGRAAGIEEPYGERIVQIRMGDPPLRLVDNPESSE